MGRIVDLFIVTYGADAVWLKYCLATARKYLKGIRDIVVVYPQGEPELRLACEEYQVKQSRIVHEDPGHMQQIAEKMKADLHCDEPDYICYIDSDCVFTKPVSVDSLFVNDRPILCYDGWEADHTHQWRVGTEWALGQKIGLNFMRRHGMIYSPVHLRALRGHVENVHGEDFTNYIRAQWDEKTEWFPARPDGKQWHTFGKPKLSEFCLMGGFVWWRFPEDFCWWRVDDFGWPGNERHGFVKQYWSHSGVTPEIQEELEGLLK
jgi:hypothetical protein